MCASARVYVRLCNAQILNNYYYCRVCEALKYDEFAVSGAWRIYSYIFLQFLAEPIIYVDDVDVDDAGNVAN